MVRNRLPAQEVNHLSRTSKIVCSKYCDIFSVLSILQYNPSKTDNKLVLNNFYSATSYRPSSNEEESNELLYTIRSLVMVRKWLKRVSTGERCVLTSPMLCCSSVSLLAEASRTRGREKHASSTRQTLTEEARGERWEGKMERGRGVSGYS